MTPDEERALHGRIERLQTEVYLLGSIVGSLLSIIGQLGYQQIEEAIIRGLTDAAASVPACNEADWDAFVAYIRKQGAAVRVTRGAASADPAARRSQDTVSQTASADQIRPKKSERPVDAPFQGEIQRKE